MATPEMLAAVSAAVKGETIPETPPAGDPPADQPAGDPPASDPPAAAREDLVGQPPAGDPPAPVLDADGRMRGPDGKFVAATPKAGDPPAGDTPAAPPAAAALATPAAPAVPPKAADPVNDPVPPNAKPETRERITSLAGMVKERDTAIAAKDTELTEVRATLDAVVGPIEEAGATPEQFRESMNLLKLMNSPHQHEQQQALQMLQGAAAALAGRLGQVLPGADPLEGFPDLQAQVQANPAMRTLAEQAARGRRFEQATTRHQQFTQQQSEQQRQRQEAINAGQAAVRAVEKSLKDANPALYEARIAVMRNDTAFVNQMRSLPPTQWAAAFAEKYATIKVAPVAAPAAPAAPATPAAPAPLRAKQPAGGSPGKPPSSMLEAVSGALRARA